MRLITQVFRSAFPRSSLLFQNIPFTIFVLRSEFIHVFAVERRSAMK